MVDVKDNTVPAENQMINSSDLRFLGDKNAPLKILVVGNSITIHGPNTEIGWLGDWGMAASSIENDYVHKLFEKLKQDGKDVYMRIRQCAFWERNYIYDNVLSNYDYERDFNADIVIFRLGENINEKDIPLFKEALEKFINHICPNGKVLFTTCFWERTRLDNDILEFADGYDTLVGEKGVTLSGGQKQRLAIARMLILDKPIIIFDDSLSAVDTKTDVKIRNALLDRKEKLTTIIITHRITTAKEADKIIVLENGKVSNIGTHEELSKKDGLYKTLWEIQGALEKEFDTVK